MAAAEAAERVRATKASSSSWPWRGFEHLDLCFIPLPSSSLDLTQLTVSRRMAAPKVSAIASFHSVIAAATRESAIRSDPGQRDSWGLDFRHVFRARTATRAQLVCPVATSAAGSRYFGSGHVAAHTLLPRDQSAESTIGCHWTRASAVIGTGGWRRPIPVLEKEVERRDTHQRPTSQDVSYLASSRCP